MRWSGLLLSLFVMNGTAGFAWAQLSDIEQLGKNLFFDATLSNPGGQSCSSCHTPAASFTDPDKSHPTSKGVISDRFGNRNSPTVSYAAFSPDFHFDDQEGLYVGGQFLDGRAVDLVAQAQAPFLNPLEMNNPSMAAVIDSIRRAPYSSLFETVFGTDALDNVDQAYVQMAQAIAAYERTSEVSPFTSKFDYVLKGAATLTPLEAKGLKLFEGKAGCAGCHPSSTPAGAPGPLFTDFTYDNIGIPKNHDSPFLQLPSELNPDGEAFIDLGLGKTVELIDPAGAADEYGKFKVSTLRNLELTGPYGHNGFFDSLKEVVHFYNTRDVAGAGWDAPEFLDTVNRDELGNLRLTDREEDAVVAFLLTLRDGYDPSITSVPEPSSIVMFATASVVALCHLARGSRGRRRKAKS